MLQRLISRHRARLACGVVLALLAGCGGEPSSAPRDDNPSLTEMALNDLQEKYDRLAGDRFEDPVKWAADDIENIGDWEYRVVEFDALPVAEWEKALNGMGDDRWEIAWVEPSPGGRVVVFKRPAVSLLSRIPLSQLGRLMMGGSGAEQ